MKFVGIRLILFVLVPILIGLIILGLITFRQVNKTMTNQAGKVKLETLLNATDVVNEFLEDPAK